MRIACGRKVNCLHVHVSRPCFLVVLLSSYRRGGLINSPSEVVVMYLRRFSPRSCYERVGQLSLILAKLNVTSELGGGGTSLVELILLKASYFSSPFI